ncbi:hypothetical protein Emag_006926 [Eimeria magna]
MDDPAPPISLTEAAEGHSGALKGLPYSRPPLHRGPPAALGLFLLLVYSVAAAAAFLVALCFRRLRPKEGGPLRGPQPRFLAGRQYPWGPPQEGVDEDATFLSNTLEACLDMETEMGLLPFSSEPLPLSETQAVNNIMWDLKDEAVLFEFQKTAAQQPTQTFFQASQWQTPAADFAYPQPMTGYEANQWSGPEAWMWGEDESLFSGAPMFSSMPSHQGPRDATASTQLVPMLQQPPIIESAPAATAATAAAAAAPAAQAWQQQQAELQMVGGPLVAESSHGVGGPLVAESSHGVGGPQRAGGSQQVGSPPEIEGSPGAFAPPAPSAGGVPASVSAPELFFLLQQQTSGRQNIPERHPSEASSPSPSSSSSEDESDSEPSPTRKRKRDNDEAQEDSSVRKASHKKHEQALSQKGPSPETGKDKAIIRRRRKYRPNMVTAAMRTFRNASSSSIVGVEASKENAPSRSSLSAPEPSESAQASSSREATKSQESTSGAPQVQPSSSVVNEGFLSISLNTGETIFFAHPPLPTPPSAPAHYRLPVVPSEAIRTRFRIEKALVGPLRRDPWPHFNSIWRLFQRPELNSKEVKELVICFQYLVRHMLTKYRTKIAQMDPSRAKGSLGLRFLAFEAIVNGIQLLGPAMNPQQWFPQLVASVPTTYISFSAINSPTAFLNNRLARLLRDGLEKLSKGTRPSPELTTEAKSLLFSSDVAPRSIPKWIRRIWKPVVDNSDPNAKSDDDFSSDEFEY